MTTRDSTFDWRSRDSAQRKYSLTLKRFGGHLPSSCLYVIDPVGSVDLIQVKEAVNSLFTKNEPKSTRRSRLDAICGPVLGIWHAADIILGRDRHLLVVRNPIIWAPWLQIDGRDCHLLQVGGGDDPLRFNFQEQWQRATFLPGTRVITSAGICDFSYRTEKPRSREFRSGELMKVVQTRFLIPWSQQHQLRVRPSHTRSSRDLEVVMLQDEQGQFCECSADMLHEAR